MVTLHYDDDDDDDGPLWDAVRAVRVWVVAALMMMILPQQQRSLLESLHRVPVDTRQSKAQG